MCAHDPEHLRQLESAVQAMLRLADKTKTKSCIYNTSNKIRIKFNKQWVMKNVEICRKTSNKARKPQYFSCVVREKSI